MTTNDLIEALDGLDDDGIKTIAEKAKTLQRHIDRRVSGAVDTAKAKATDEPDPATALDAKEKLLERKEHILALAAERGIDHREAYKFLGVDDEDLDDADRLDALVEYGKNSETKAKDQILKDHARTPRISQLSTETPDDQILGNPEHYPPDIVNAALDRGMAKEREKRTLRQVMGGGR